MRQSQVNKTRRRPRRAPNDPEAIEPRRDLAVRIQATIARIDAALVGRTRTA